MGIVAIGAGIAVLTGLGAGIGIGIAPASLRRPLPGSRSSPQDHQKPDSGLRPGRVYRHLRFAHRHPADLHELMGGGTGWVS